MRNRSTIKFAGIFLGLVLALCALPLFAQPSQLMQAPTSADADRACDGGAPSSVTDGLSLADSDFKWTVVDGLHPVMTGEGTLTSIKYTETDFPTYHNSHDVDMNLNLRQRDVNLMVQGQGAMGLESELWGFPARVQPLPGDHVKVLGLWIFDCPHHPRSSELHPLASS